MFGLNNPNRLLQPWKNVKQFSEELYAMFSSKAPVEHEGPVTIRVKEGQTALTLKRGSEGQFDPRTPPQPTRPRSAPTPARPKFGDATMAVPADRATIGPTSAPTLSKKYKPLLAVEGGIDFRGNEPVRFETPPQVRNPKTGKFESIKDPIDFSEPPHKDNVLASKKGKGGGLAGIVTGGTGPTWNVDLYEGGPAGEFTESITVNIPKIADDEDAPVGLWLFGISKLTVDDEDIYYFQPPVWLE